MELDPVFLASLEELIEPSQSTGDDRTEKELISHAARSLIERLYSINQYIQVNAEQVRALEAIYSSTWHRITQTGEISTELKSHHYPKLRTWVAQFYPESMRAALRSRLRLGSVPNEEYSAALQVRLLKLDLSLIKQPVLDIGCGKHGSLVQYLRAHRVEAYGIDRVIGKERNHLNKADWLTFQMKPIYWGTVISHLAFSSHFAYVQRIEPGRVGAYRNKYREMLSSLTVGGSLILAPGAPALEAETDRNMYDVEEWDIQQPYKGVKVTRIAR